MAEKKITLPVVTLEGAEAGKVTLDPAVFGVKDVNPQVIKDAVTVNAKSIMGVLMLAAEYGSTLQVQCNGSDEKQALRAICGLFESKFNEEY